jgi:DNA-binding SARP family transcriptional activator
MMAMLEFHLLGHVDIYASGSCRPVGGVAQRTLLLALLLRADQTVRVEALMNELWGTSWPENPENALHAHVSRLRRTLLRAEPGRAAPRLLADRTGYRLLAADDEIDGRRFQTLVARLRQRGGTMPPEGLARALREALRAWREPLFGGVLGGPICAAGGLGYERAWQESTALFFDAELRCGNHARVIAELRPLVATYSPCLEQFTEQLMIALYRSGRQVDALQIYQRTVRRLSAHGDVPGARLKWCEWAILNQDEALDRTLAHRPIAALRS